MASLAHDAARSSALTGLRIVDMSGMAGQYCGKMFADLGAEVILVEPPGGSSVRRGGPFLNDRPHHETSLTFTYFNTGKRGIVLDLDCQAGQAIMRRLTAGANLLIETEKPGVMNARGLDFDSLTTSAPNIIVTSITPFGQSGPFARYEAEDLILLAIGGLLSLGGYVDTTPIAAYGNQAYLAGAQFAAVASLMALLANERERGNARGRHIDISIQECVVLALENAAQFFDLENITRRREGGQQKLAGMGLFRCLDGYVYLMAGGIASSSFWDNTIGWFEQEGVEGASQLKEDRWRKHEFLETAEAKASFESIFAPFAARHTKSHLYSAGQAHRIPICPVNTTKDIVENRQLISREFFAQVEHTFSRQSLKVPGAPYRLTKTPWCLSRPSPMLGEHTAEVLSELGFGAGEQAAFFKAGVLG
jgi:benzylsuccinate CoA-transferase BbsE subunit